MHRDGGRSEIMERRAVKKRSFGTGFISNCHDIWLRLVWTFYWFITNFSISSTTTVSPVRSSGAPLFYWSVAISSRKQPPATNKNTGKLAKSGVHLSAIYSNFVYDGWYLL